MQQNDAFDLLKMGKNIFLTGAAGSGKTYLLNKYIKYLRVNHVGVAVTASTGIAATHLQGTTIHSWSGIGVKDHLVQKDLEKLLETKVKRNYEKTKVLIIDEISMLHKHQLDMVDMIARFILKGDKPFGDMQVVLCGDFFQLPPVTSNAYIKEKQFAFEADAWRNGDFYICYLNEQHRQGNDPLLTILNDIRSGTAGEHTKVPLRTRYKKEPLGPTKTTKLYSRNINVDAINEKELARIHGEEKIFTMTTQGPHGLVEGLKRNCLAPEQLKLKIGAEVMFVKNEPSCIYVNGTRCVVVGFDEIEGWPVVKTHDNKIITASEVEWTYEDNGVARATITQVPLRLAWAITIHKSQGMTLNAAEVDLGDAFEPGMGYVALSRIRSLNGLKLMNLNEMALRVDPKILNQDKIFKENSESTLQHIRAMSEKEKSQHQKETLIERFKGIMTKIENDNNENNVSTYSITLNLLQENMSIESIAEKRGLSVETIIKHLEKLKELNKLDSLCLSYLKQIFLDDDFDIIFSELKTAKGARLKAIYEKFNGRYSYANIKIVRLFTSYST